MGDENCNLCLKRHERKDNDEKCMINTDCALYRSIKYGGIIE